MKTQLSIAALLLASGAVMAVACSSTNGNPTPDGGTGASVVVGPAASSTGTGSPTASASSGGGGMGGATTSSTTTGAGAGSTCYDGGTPMTTPDFLNPCEPSATCQTYPNSTLPGRSSDGGLPPLGP
jgi:hypothetical protein